MPTPKFDHIIAIYNPNSTNDAETKAKNFATRAKKSGYRVKLYPTTHRGHASEIAHEIVEQYHHPLLISVSGDGGYNELINGVMRAKRGTQKEPVVAIIAAGNANDHKRLTRGDTPLLRLIKSHRVRPLDLLRLRAGALDRYAHSYIGLGITPEVGIELNKHDLNRFTEVKLILKTFRRFRPFALKRDGSNRRYANLIFANISGMSKVIKLDPEANKLGDGKFEVIAEPWRGKLRLIAHLLKLVIFGSPESPQYKTYSFTTVDAITPVQLDGEIEELIKGADVTVTAQNDAILSLY